MIAATTREKILFSSDLELAKNLAEEAGRLLMSYFGNVAMELKGDKNVVTQADRAAEDLIARRLAELRPQDNLIAEEGTNIDTGGKRSWVVDPLDATNNFAHGFFVFSVSIALMEAGRVQVGVVHAPAIKQTFWATVDGGAFLNGERIHVSAIDRLSHAVCATGFPYARRTLARNNLAEFNRVMMEVQGIRRVGAASLDLCWVAQGVWDGYWEIALQPWDVAAGMLICREAGGTVTDFAGGPVDIQKPEIAATNGLIHQELLDLLNAGE